MVNNYISYKGRIDEMNDETIQGLVIGYYLGFSFCWVIDWLYKKGFLKELGDDDGPEISD